MLSRLSKSKNIDKIILATSIDSANDKLSEKVKTLGYDVFEEVKKMFWIDITQLQDSYNPSIIVRITGDCPIIDPVLVDQVSEMYIKNNVDYVSNNHPPTYPDGFRYREFFHLNLLKFLGKMLKSQELEHVTPYILNNARFKELSYENAIDCSKERWTVDEIEDFEVIKNILNHFYPNIFFSWQEVFELKKNHPNYFIANKNIIRNEGGGSWPWTKIV